VKITLDPDLVAAHSKSKQAAHWDALRAVIAS